MRTNFWERVGVQLAILDVSEDKQDFPGCFWINRINVPEAWRGTGIARKLLKQCLDEADREGKALILAVSPSDGLDFKQLMAWYKRHGFADIDGQPLGILLREPQRA